MPHNIIDIRRNLDCIATNYSESASSANDLKRAADDGEIYYQASLVDAGKTNGEAVHELLEDIEALSADWCNNGTSLGATERNETLDDFTSSMNELVNG